MTTNRFDTTLGAQIELTERIAIAIVAGDFAGPDNGEFESLANAVKRIWMVAEAHAAEAIRRRKETNRTNCGAT